MRLRSLWSPLLCSLLVATGCGTNSSVTTQATQPFNTPDERPATEPAPSHPTQGQAQPSYVQGKRCGDVAGGGVTRYGLFIPARAAQITCEEALTVVRRFLESYMSNGPLIVGGNTWFCRDTAHSCTAGRDGLISFADDY